MHGESKGRTTLNIVIPIKQVPETGNVKMDEETGTMKRDGVESIVNPLDLYAIEAGLELREHYGGTVKAVTMGPPSANKALREAIAMGCDGGVLITGKEFAGSDTAATSYALAEAIKNMGSADLVLCGERATDGDTGQVGPGIASFLGISLATYVSRIQEAEDGAIIAERLIESGYEKLRVELPALLTVVKEINYPRLPTLRGKQRAKRAVITEMSARGIGIDESRVGLEGSPTRVVKIETPKVTRGGRIVAARDEEGVSKAVDGIIDFLSSKELI
jgi:electron transfer flavoprotein beta subunit